MQNHLRKPARILIFLILRALLMVAGLFFSLLLVELGVRVYEQLFKPLSDPGTLPVVQNVPWGWSYIPNTRRLYSSSEGDEYEQMVNSLGLRDHEYTLKKPAGTFRILLLGDSFGADGRIRLEDMYHALVEKSVNEVLDTPVEVINTSVSGWGTSQQLVYYEEEGRQFEADLVLLVFCMCNDVIDNYAGWAYQNKPTFSVRDGELIQVGFPATTTVLERGDVVGDFEAASFDTKVRLSIPLRIRKWSMENLHLFPYIQSASNHIPLVNRLLISIGLREDIRLLHQIFMIEEPPEITEAWTVTKALLERLNREVRQDSADFAVLVIHSPYQVETAYWWEPEFDFYPAMYDAAWDLQRPDRILRDSLEQEQISYYFLVDGFADHIASTGNLTTWKRDPHWNLIGHELAGRLTAEWLLTSGLLPD